MSFKILSLSLLLVVSSFFITGCLNKNDCSSCCPATSSEKKDCNLSKCCEIDSHEISTKDENLITLDANDIIELEDEK